MYMDQLETEKIQRKIRKIIIGIRNKHWVREIKKIQAQVEIAAVTVLVQREPGAGRDSCSYNTWAQVQEETAAVTILEQREPGAGRDSFSYRTWAERTRCRKW
jgi:hypothetical protein